MSDLLSGGIHFTGLGSGSDFDTMIDQLKKVESIQMKRMALWRSDWQKRVEAFNEINTLMGNLRTTLSGMDTTTEFMVKNAYSSSDSVANATAGPNAQEGSYRLYVHQLARAGTVITSASNGVESLDSKVTTSGAGEQILKYTYKGETRTLKVAEGTTMTNLLNMINKDSKNPGVHASAIRTGENYVLQIQGKETGAKNTLKIESDSTLAVVQGAISSVTAQDAKFKVNGFPIDDTSKPGYDKDDPDTWTYMTSESNTLTGAVEGVSVGLRQKGETQITVTTDSDKVKEKIEKFVEDMNAVRQKIMELSKVDKDASVKDPNKTKSQYDAEIGSVLTGNYGVQLLSSNLKLATAGKPKGFTYYDAENKTGDFYSTLSQIGILTIAKESDPKNGLLEIDYEKLDEALNERPNDLASLFAADGVGESDNGNFSYYSHIDGTTAPGEYEVKYEIDAAGNLLGDATINGHPAKYNPETHELTAYGYKPGRDKDGKLTSFGSGPERGLVIRIDNRAPGKYEGNIAIKAGKMAEINAMVGESLSQEGTLKIIEKNYKDIIKQIDKKIEREDERISRWEKHQRLKFARLESTLTMLNGQMKSLGSMVTQANKS